MTRDLLTIIIPTRDRHDTLFKVVDHLVEANISSTKILISDNHSDPFVQDFLGPLPSSFSIIRTPSRLSMPESWRFALRHITTPYVTIIGDDDIVWTSRLVSLFPLLEKDVVPAVFWYRHAYYWSSFKDSPLAGVLFFTRDFQLSSVDLDNLIKVVFPQTISYGWLPSIYNALIRTDTAIELFGSLEEIIPHDCIAPDMASGFRICSTFKWGIHSSSPITISGISNNSNGMNPKHHSQFFYEFGKINMRPSWLSNIVRPVNLDGNGVLGTIHDFFSGVSFDVNMEFDPARFPKFFLKWIQECYDSDGIAVVKSGLKEIFPSNDRPEQSLPVRIKPLEAGVFPNIQQEAVKLAHDYNGNEISALARFLNSN